MIFCMKAGILTASDRCSRGERPDESGLLLKKLTEGLPAEVIAYKVFPDDKKVLKKALCHMADKLRCDFILTTGGTGLAPRDNMPEATREVIEKDIPGLQEMLRHKGSHKTRFAVLSRGVAGIRHKTLIMNLPGSPEAVRDSFEVLKDILPHAVELILGIRKDCREIREREKECSKPPAFRFLHSHS